MNERAKARNESFFREVNDRIEAVSETIPAREPTMEFLCECDDLQCQETLRVTRAEYENVRAEPTHFIVRPDHVDGRIEHVVRATDRFSVVEKDGVAAVEAELDAE
jgi:hypothetical protein